MMSTQALIWMILVQGTVTSIIIYLYYKILKKPDS